VRRGSQQSQRSAHAEHGCHTHDSCDAELAKRPHGHSNARAAGAMKQRAAASTAATYGVGGKGCGATYPARSAPVAEAVEDKRVRLAVKGAEARKPRHGKHIGVPKALGTAQATAKWGRHEIGRTNGDSPCPHSLRQKHRVRGSCARRTPPRSSTFGQGACVWGGGAGGALLQSSHCPQADHRPVAHRHSALQEVEHRAKHDVVHACACGEKGKVRQGGMAAWDGCRRGGDG
jgi:hypothetical protein